MNVLTTMLESTLIIVNFFNFCMMERDEKILKVQDKSLVYFGYLLINGLRVMNYRTCIQK